MWPWPPAASPARIVRDKRAARAHALAAAPAERPAHASFLKATAADIVAHIARGEWTAAAVLDAYIARAAAAHAATNCLTEVLFAQARADAAALDAEFAATGRLRGPLHGVPVSFKDQFEIAGVDASLGFTGWAQQPSTRNAAIVDTLRAAGAVPIAKTNVPQTLFSFECANPLFGRTSNPHNAAYTSGGSSGGEAALLALDGAALGVGTDIGGSLRIPAGYCGVYSLKPGAGRVSDDGMRSPTPGMTCLDTVIGPLGRSVADLTLFCRAAFGVPGRTRDVAPLAFREVALPRVLRFGYYTSDGYVKAAPACARAVRETVAALRAQGHECVEIAIPDAAAAFNIFIGLTAADGFATLLAPVGADARDASLALVTLGPRLPRAVRALAAWAAARVLGDALLAGTVRAARPCGAAGVMALSAARGAYARQFEAAVWARHALDAVLAPVQALPQLAHGGSAALSALAAGTALYNVVDAPVGCVPVTRVDAARDALPPRAAWAAAAGHGSGAVEGLLFGAGGAYDPAAAAGMPVGVQIVGRRWEEEKVLAMMGVVDRALGERGFGPGSCAGPAAGGEKA